MKRMISVAVLMLVGTAGGASAAPASGSLSAQFTVCWARAGTNVVQKDICAQREVGAQDDRLNKAYQRVLHQLAEQPDARIALRDDERRWIAERDYTCKVNGQTIDEGCVVMKTAARADELERRVRF